MAEQPVSLVRLMSWLSPAFPVGAFAYSHAIESAIQCGAVHDRTSLTDWLAELLRAGSIWNDTVLLAEAWRRTANGERFGDISELAEAMAGSRERHMETTLQGAAFGEAVTVWQPASQRGLGAPEVMPYPVAVGVAAARHAIALNDVLVAYCHAFTLNLIQAAVRLIPLGQRDGVAALAALEPLILASASRASDSSLDDLGSCTVLSDILSMQHEIQYSRVFRS